MTNCIESMTCMPQNPLDVFNLYDVWYGTGASMIVMASIIGIILVAIYVKNRSMPMLTILGLYTFTAFSTILTNQYISAQYHVGIYVLIVGGAVAFIMMILRLTKE